MGTSVNIDNNAEGREGGSTSRGTGEGALLSILLDDESPSRVLGIQHASELENLQILIASVFDGGGDPQVGCGRDFVGGGRGERFETTTGVNRGLGVSPDGGKTESNERHREYDDAKRYKGNWIED